MSDIAFHHITDKHDSQQDADSGIDEHQQVAAQKCRNIELQQPPIGEVHQCFQQHSSQTGQESHQHTQRKEEAPVADMPHAPHDKALIVIFEPVFHHLTVVVTTPPHGHYCITTSYNTIVFKLLQTSKQQSETSDKDTSFFTIYKNFSVGIQTTNPFLTL